jgi:hypothetical protein
MKPQTPRKAPVATWAELRRCSSCGTKAIAILLTLTPCGCKTNQCMRCADNAAPAIGGPLRAMGADVTRVLVHLCGVVAPVTAWRVQREALV